MRGGVGGLDGKMGLLERRQPFRVITFKVSFRFQSWSSVTRTAFTGRKGTGEGQWRDLLARAELQPNFQICVHSLSFSKKRSAKR